MTWKELKQKLEQQGLADNDRIAWIVYFGDDDAVVARRGSGKVQVQTRRPA